MKELDPPTMIGASHGGYGVDSKRSHVTKALGRTLVRINTPSRCAWYPTTFFFVVLFVAMSSPFIHLYFLSELTISPWKMRVAKSMESLDFPELRFPSPPQPYPFAVVG
ncbi:hypothetical protein HAX54_005791 [Datura stramonium]|uniref:Uncharacterized protein n=1 Tax=Datura stramonium TaxID=4076 RepID=A0ABS8TAJ0_DATST|nr:hypothetical protein [Datura stramonium]